MAQTDEPHRAGRADPDRPPLAHPQSPGRGPHPVRKMACGMCTLVYQELYTAAGPPPRDMLVGACPRCGASTQQEQVGRGEA